MRGISFQFALCVDSAFLWSQPLSLFFLPFPSSPLFSGTYRHSQVSTAKDQGKMVIDEVAVCADKATAINVSDAKLQLLSKLVFVTSLRSLVPTSEYFLVTLSVPALVWPAQTMFCYVLLLSVHLGCCIVLQFRHNVWVLCDQVLSNFSLTAGCVGSWSVSLPLLAFAWLQAYLFTGAPESV